MEQQVAIDPMQAQQLAEQQRMQLIDVYKRIQEYKSMGRDNYVKNFGYDTEAQLYDDAERAGVHFSIDYDFGDYAQQALNEGTMGLYGLFDNDVADEGKYSRGRGMGVAKGVGFLGSMAATGGMGLAAKAARGAVLTADAVRMAKLAKASKALLGVSDDIARQIGTSSGKVLGFMEKKGASQAEFFGSSAASRGLRREFIEKGGGTLKDIDILKSAGKATSGTDKVASGIMKKASGWWNNAVAFAEKKIADAADPNSIDHILNPNAIDKAVAASDDIAKIVKVKGARISDAGAFLEKAGKKMVNQGRVDRVVSGAKFGAGYGAVTSGTEAWSTDTDYLPADMTTKDTFDRMGKTASAALGGGVRGAAGGAFFGGIANLPINPKYIVGTGAGVSGLGLAYGNPGLTKLGGALMLSGGLKAVPSSRAAKVIEVDRSRVAGRAANGTPVSATNQLVPVFRKNGPLVEIQQEGQRLLPGGQRLLQGGQKLLNDRASKVSILNTIGTLKGKGYSFEQITETLIRDMGMPKDLAIMLVRKHFAA